MFKTITFKKDKNEKYYKKLLEKNFLSLLYEDKEYIFNHGFCHDELHQDLGFILRFAIKNGPIPDAEQCLLTEPYFAVQYAIHVIKGRWSELENVITNVCDCFCYATEALHGRFIKGEDILKTSPYFATRYSIEILQDRWLEAEPYISKSAFSSFQYAQHIIKGPWPEAESIILDSEYKEDYLRFIKELNNK